MAFNKNIPQPNDDLSVSQVDLLNNNMQLNTSFGIDHYPFDDITVNNGFHNVVTEPLIIGSPPAHPATSATVCKIYTMKDSTNLPLLQYSRGASNAVPSPITNISNPLGGSSITGGATINLLDCTGLSMAFFNFYTFIKDVNNQQYTATIFFDGTGFRKFEVYPAGGNVSTVLHIVFSGKIIQLMKPGVTATNTLYWTLEPIRIEV